MTTVENITPPLETLDEGQGNQTLVQSVSGSVKQISTASGLYDIHDARTFEHVDMTINPSLQNVSNGGFGNYSIGIDGLILLHFCIILSASTDYSANENIHLCTIDDSKYFPSVDMSIFRALLISNAGTVNALTTLTIGTDGKIYYRSSTKHTVGGLYVVGCPVALNGANVTVA